MPIDQEFCDRLVCPETKEPVSLAEADLITRLNAQIQSGQLKNHSGQTIDQPIDGGILRQDGKVLYPIRDDIPVMLISERIPIE